MTVAGLTDIGKVRSQNQDAFFISTEPIGPLPNLFIVADGMGGHNAGEIASKSAVEVFCENIQRAAQGNNESFLDIMVSAAAEANANIYKQASSDSDYYGMGTTFTACVLSGSKCEIVHVGDSRAYIIEQGKMMLKEDVG